MFPNRQLPIPPVMIDQYDSQYESTFFPRIGHPMIKIRCPDTVKMSLYWDSPLCSSVSMYSHHSFLHAICFFTQWSNVMHICVSKLTNIGSDNGLSFGRCQVTVWTNAGILSIGPLGTNFSEKLIEIYIFSFKKMHLLMSSGNCPPFCVCLNVLTIDISYKITNKKISC